MVIKVFDLDTPSTPDIYVQLDPDYEDGSVDLIVMDGKTGKRIVGSRIITLSEKGIEIHSGVNQETGLQLDLAGRVRIIGYEEL